MSAPQQSPSQQSPPPPAQDQGCMKSSPKLAEMKRRQDGNIYIRNWKVSCMDACCNSPGFFCYTCLCPCCVSCELRKRALHDDVTRYKCCNGQVCPCISDCCCEASCPSFCMCLESFCCFTTSVWVTRYMIMDEMRLQADSCDGCIIGTLIVLETMACICSILGCILGAEECTQAALLCYCIAEAIWLSVCGCLQTQHKVELDARDKDPSSIPPALPPMYAPQQQMVQMGNNAVYPAPGPYPQQGYPQQGYPQQQYMPSQGQYAPMPPPGAYPPPQMYPPPASVYPPAAQYPPPPPQEMK